MHIVHDTSYDTPTMGSLMHDTVPHEWNKQTCSNKIKPQLLNVASYQERRAILVCMNI
jgi:hypothetical protein